MTGYPSQALRRLGSSILLPHSTARLTNPVTLFVRSPFSRLALALLALSCGPPEPASRSAAGTVGPVNGVAIYDPGAAWNGYTLDFDRRQYPMLIDMRGNVVRSWPEIRMKSRVRLTSECTLLGIGTGRAVIEHDWDGNKIFSAAFEGRYPHHDVIRLASGNTMFLTRADGDRGDDVFEVDAAGDVVWEWRALEPLGPHLEGRRPSGDPIHLNSVQELPENPWFRAGDERFRPGNLLLSARNLNLVLILDPRTREIVWTYEGDLSLQHEALMVGPESDHGGKILIFDNRYKSFWTDRRSHVIEIDPRDGSTTWSYSAAGFHSSTGGSQQPLPNGNVLIASSNNGRAFEVTRAGQTVWEWVPDFRLNRPSRYARDHCPELRDLPPPEGPPVRPPSGYRHADRDSYRVARSEHQKEIVLDGVKRRVLQPSYRCARVLVPGDASARLRYGIDRARIRRLGLAAYRADFSLTLRDPEGEGPAVVVFEDSLDAAGAGWRERTLGLAALAFHLVELCVELTEEGLEGRAKPGTLAHWGSPSLAAGREPDEADGDETPEDLTPEELEVRLEHLRAMGYVN